MAQATEQDWATALDSMSDELDTMFRSDEGFAERVSPAERGEPHGLTLGKGIHQRVSLPIHNGKGSKETPRKTTFGVTVSGAATIAAPAEGTWRLRVIDTQYPPPKYPPIIDKSGVKKGQPIPFKYKTGWSCQLRVEAIWSEQADTTLAVDLDASY